MTTDGHNSSPGPLLYHGGKLTRFGVFAGGLQLLVDALLVSTPPDWTMAGVGAALAIAAYFFSRKHDKTLTQTQ